MPACLLLLPGTLGQPDLLPLLQEAHSRRCGRVYVSVKGESAGASASTASLPPLQQATTAGAQHVTHVLVVTLHIPGMRRSQAATQAPRLSHPLPPVSSSGTQAIQVNQQLLQWLAEDLYAAVGQLDPRWDVVPCLECAGWTAGRCEQLPTR